MFIWNIFLFSFLEVSFELVCYFVFVDIMEIRIGRLKEDYFKIIFKYNFFFVKVYIIFFFLK